jgi:hypothetical protein
MEPATQEPQTDTGQTDAGTQADAELAVELDALIYAGLLRLGP